MKGEEGDEKGKEEDIEVKKMEMEEEKMSEEEMEKIYGGRKWRWKEGGGYL